MRNARLLLLNQLQPEKSHRVGQAASQRAVTTTEFTNKFESGIESKIGNGHVNVQRALMRGKYENGAIAIGHSADRSICSENYESLKYKNDHF
jgi:hypothetical protein